MTPPQSPTRSRRLPATALVLLGAAITTTFGFSVAKMSFGAPLVMLGLGGAALVLCGLALFRIVDPLLRSDAGKLEEARTPLRVRELEREKQAVLKAIREIELDYHMRKISDGYYQELTQRYRNRAMGIMRELDAGGDYRSLIEQELRNRLTAADAAGTTKQAACGACGAPNDADAIFCKKCGKKCSETRPETAGGSK